jgi:putative protease
MTRIKMPELLMPVGGPDKLPTALLYGADAVYLGGEKFGLRTRASNFNASELKAAKELCRTHGVKMYVVLNGLLYDSDLGALPDFVKILEEVGVDAVIAGDLGVIETVKRTAPSIPIHLSTQSSCINSHGALFWKEVGVKRVILGREATIAEAGSIKKISGLEVEIFVHGSMCMAYSGHCVISNYTAGRDSNRGGCAHSCRFAYSLKGDKVGEKKSQFFMSSKDLQGIHALKECVEHGIDSLKVEGRMKGPLYLASVAKTYRAYLDWYASAEKKGPGQVEISLSDPNPSELEWANELAKVSGRGTCSGNLLAPAGADSIESKVERQMAAELGHDVVGQVMQVVPGKFGLVSCKLSLTPDAEVEVVPFKGQSYPLVLRELYDVTGQRLDRAVPNTLLRIPYSENLEKWNLLRMRVN